MKKPTGTGKRPACVTHAKAIDKLINEKLGTRNINDDEDDEQLMVSGDDGQENAEPIHTVTARAEDRSIPSRRRTTRTSHAMELTQKLSDALDPQTQRLRDEDRAVHSLQTTQIFTISQQLRDSNAVSDTLRRENTELREHLDRISRHRDRLDMELNLERRMSSLTSKAHDLPRRLEHKYDPTLRRVKGKIRHDEYFSDGGQCTSWITDGSSSSDWDREKENISPQPSLRPYSRTNSTWSGRSPSMSRTFHSRDVSTRSPDRGYNFPAPSRCLKQSAYSSDRNSNVVPYDFPGPLRCMKKSNSEFMMALKPQHMKFKDNISLSPLTSFPDANTLSQPTITSPSQSISISNAQSSSASVQVALSSFA